MNLKSLFGLNDYETITETNSREMTVEFERVTVLFNFARGGEKPLEYDVFSGNLKTQETTRETITDGILTGKRGDTSIEKLCKVVDAHPIREIRRPESETKLNVMGKACHEVTPSNVNARTKMESTDMRIVVPITEKLELRADTEEIVSQYPPTQDDDVRIETSDVNYHE